MDLESASPIPDLPAQALNLASALRLFHGAFLAAIAGSGFYTRRVNINGLAQERLEAAQRIVQIAGLTTMGLRLYDDNEIIGNAAIPKLSNSAAIGFIDVKTIEIAAQLHRGIGFIDRLPAGARGANG